MVRFFFTISSILTFISLVNTESNRDLVLRHPQTEFFETPKPLSEFEVTSLLITSDIEGNLNALNRNTGELLWSLIGDQPLVDVKSNEERRILTHKITTGLHQDNTTKTTTAGITWIIEPYGEGSIYQFTQNGLNKLPITIKEFINNSPFSIEDAFVYTGTRRSGIVKINARTGSIVESYGLYEKDTECSYLDSDEDPIITLGKTFHELTVHTNKTTYNITYVEWGPNNLHSDLIQFNTESQDNLYIQPFHDNSLLAVDSHTKTVRWVANLPFTTINVFDILHDQEINGYIVLPHPIDQNNSHGSATYIDKTKEGSWYALSEAHYPSLVRSAPLSKYIMNERWRLPSIFMNDDLLSISITGVHDDSTGLDGNVAIYNPVRLPTSKVIIGDAGVPDSASWHENKKNVIYDDKPTTTTGGLVSLQSVAIRALENVIVSILCIMIFWGMSRLGLVKWFSNAIKNDNDTLAIETGAQVLETNKEINQSEDSNKVLNDDIHVEIPDSKQEVENVSNTSNSANSTSASLQPESDIDIEIIKKRRKRGTRGGKKNKRKPMELQINTISGAISNSQSSEPNNKLEILTEPEIITKISDSLSITDYVLGFGSHGTMVFKGYFENRPVAVKRMLIDFYDVASHEIQLLQESDDHSNVVRYFCSQENNKFLYIALELCSASLEAVIEKNLVNIPAPNILWQIANGVHHLHSLKIVHRDIKPQNILVVLPKKKQKNNSIRFLISDFGLCKKLDGDQSSFRGTTAHAAGTSGWRAPELLSGKDRLTRSVDIFAVGCVFYYVLSKGGHPFGGRFIREGMIIQNKYDLSGIDSLEDSIEAKDLIIRMLRTEPNERPDIEEVIKHPYFWSIEKKIEFLLKVSDRFEVERRDPPSKLLLKFESIAIKIVGSKGWHAKFDANFMDNLGKYRKYNENKLLDLLRAMRNKYHHYQDLPEELAKEMTPPEGFYKYFANKFPNMLLEIYLLLKGLLRDEELLAAFFT